MLKLKKDIKRLSEQSKVEGKIKLNEKAILRVEVMKRKKKGRKKK